MQPLKRFSRNINYIAKYGLLLSEINKMRKYMDTRIYKCVLPIIHACIQNTHVSTDTYKYIEKYLIDIKNLLLWNEEHFFLLHIFLKFPNLVRHLNFVYN